MNTKNIRHYIATLIVALLPLVAAATPATLSIEDFTISAGETQTMLIDLNNPDTQVTLVQFDLRLPTGLSIAVEEEELAVDIAGRTTWKKHSLSTSSVNGATRFLLASQSNAVITGTSGAIISVTLTAASTFNGGDIILENQLIVTPTEEATQPADYTYTIAGSGTGEKCATPTITINNGTLTFSSTTSGATCHYEITRAGEGSSVQLSATSDYVVKVWATKAGYLDSDVATTTITMKQGDVNGDGGVSITDAVAVVNIILNGGEATAAPSLSEPEEAGQVPE